MKKLFKSLFERNTKHCSACGGTMEKIGWFLYKCRSCGRTSI